MLADSPPPRQPYPTSPYLQTGAIKPGNSASFCVVDYAHDAWAIHVADGVVARDVVKVDVVREMKQEVVGADRDNYNTSHHPVGR